MTRGCSISKSTEGFKNILGCLETKSKLNGGAKNTGLLVCMKVGKSDLLRPELTTRDPRSSQRVNF